MTTLEPMINLQPTAALNVIAPGHFVGRPGSLAQSVQAAVRAVDEATMRPVARRDAGLAFQPKALLALLSYCYARQIYASAEIAGSPDRRGSITVTSTPRRASAAAVLTLCSLHALRSGRGCLVARHLPLPPGGEKPASRHRLGKHDAAVLRRSALGRL